MTTLNVYPRYKALQYDGTNWAEFGALFTLAGHDSTQVDVDTGYGTLYVPTTCYLVWYVMSGIHFVGVYDPSIYSVLWANELSLAGYATTAYVDAAAPAYSQSSPARALDTVFVPHATRNVEVSYAVDIAVTLSLSGNQVGTVFLEISADGSTGWTEKQRFTNGNSGTVVVGVAMTQTVTGALTCTVPAGYSVRLRTNSVTGAPVFTYRSGQETLI